MKKEIKAFRERLLIDAIMVIEDNDYVGLLIEKANVIIRENGFQYHRETPSMLMTEMIEAIRELENYRLLNLSLKDVQNVCAGYDSVYFERYFKSRIISAKRTFLRLSRFGSSTICSYANAAQAFLPK